jgi:hypothetical protein
LEGEFYIDFLDRTLQSSPTVRLPATNELPRIHRRSTNNTLTMKNFKYPLSISGSEQELKNFIPKLEGLGYRIVDRDYIVNSFNRLVTNFASHSFNGGNVGFGAANGIAEYQQIRHPIALSGNEDLILALAAMVDDEEKFYEGEWVKLTGYGDSSFSPDSQPSGFQIGKLYKLGGHYFKTYKRDFYVEANDRGVPDGHNEFEFRKATKEEIINHFKQNNMNNLQMTQLAENARGKEVTVEIPVSFVKEAHKEACSKWKQKIEKIAPSVFERFYKVGQMFALYGRGTRYQLIGGQVNGASYVNITSEDGSVINNSLTVTDINKITQKEMQQLLDARFGNVREFEVILA